MSRSAQVLPSRLLILLIALASAFLLISTGVEADQPLVTETHVVERGDTLWEIAADVTPAGSDVRATIQLIEEINGLEGAELHPGQRLEVPSG